MLFNVVVSLLLLYVIVKLRLWKSLLKLILSICCIPFILISKCCDWCKVLVTQQSTKRKKSKKNATDQEFYEELQQLLERYNKTSI